MAIKKSELYSSLWSSCDELRGGMDDRSGNSRIEAGALTEYLTGVALTWVRLP